MQKGKVKFYNFSKGYGFIAPEDGGEDIFVHQSGLTEDIRDNDSVEFETEEGKKGMNAVRVKVVR
ncbi:cold-shock protein [Algoriphagus sediminis]|uniref:Cold shock domain-containing protein n=1 Tax=Algoriphagus sediminis TaxID=3057113 RepID=A0ABT7YD05_9BACT|nr:cold shock domain-containing protein [Algoriphagus sediminis]MDN3204408.1 cold shock domain-containing protein [Algoriphagus sediminis]